MTCEFSSKPAARRYRRDFGIGMGLYVASLMAVVFTLNRVEVAPWLAVLLALAPVLPVLYALRAYIIFVGAADELQRRVQHEAIVVSAAIVAMASFAYGLLEDLANFPHISLIWVMPALCAVWGVAAAFVSRRYR